MPIQRSDLLGVAKLARLQLTDEELERLVRDCQAILGHFAVLQELDVQEVEPWGGGAEQVAAPLREDQVGCDPLHRPLQALAPVWREGFFVLPRLPAMDAETADEAGTE